MDYDLRNKSGSSLGRPMYGPSSPSPSPASNHPMYGYPKIGQQTGHGQQFFPPPGRSSSFQHNTSPFPSSSSYSSGFGIKVTMKPEYRITPPPQLLPRVGDIPRSNFQFDFGLERKVLAEAEKDNPDWSKFGNHTPPAKFPEPSPSSLGVDPVVMRYVASGLNREAVNIAVANYGDNPTKVQEFANGFTAIREMGFPTNSVAEALFMFDNDTEKALAHLLHGSS